MNCLRASDNSKEHADQIPMFVTKIKEEFQPYEISDFFENSKNFPNLILDEEGQMEMDKMRVGSDEYEISEMEEDMDIVGNAEALLRLERAKELLVG